MPKSKILIADDNLTNVELLEAYLDGIECEMAVAVDGRDTAEAVADWKQSVVDGWEGLLARREKIVPLAADQKGPTKAALDASHTARPHPPLQSI